VAASPRGLRIALRARAFASDSSRDEFHPSDANVTVAVKVAVAAIVRRISPYSIGSRYSAGTRSASQNASLAR
jgi:hypothetical protein